MARSARQALAPAIKLAEKGITVSPELAASLRTRPSASAVAVSAKIFYNPDGTPYAPGEVLVQTDLALAAGDRRGRADGFYDGPIAKAIVAEVRRAGGNLTPDDIAAYQAVVRAPVERQLPRLRDPSRCRRRPRAACTSSRS